MKTWWHRVICAWSGHAEVMLTPRQAGLSPILVHLTAHSPVRIMMCKRCGKTRMLSTASRNGRLA